MFREGLRPPDPFRESHPFETAMTQDGVSLKVMSGYGEVLVVCLPKLSHGKPMLKQLAAARHEVERTGLRVILVHIEEEAPREVLEAHDLWYVARIADPRRALYAELGLEQKRGLLGGRRQAGGAFVLHKGEVLRQLGSKPDYRMLVGGA